MNQTRRMLSVVESLIAYANKVVVRESANEYRIANPQTAVLSAYCEAISVLLENWQINITKAQFLALMARIYDESNAKREQPTIVH